MVTIRENCPVTSGTVTVETLAHRQVWEPVPCQNSHAGLSWCSLCRQAALWYSLIKPWTTCVRLILPVISTGWPGSCSGGR
jgi:hypothetical protein